MYSPQARKPLGLSGAEQKLCVLNLEGSCRERCNKVSTWPNTSPDSTLSRLFQVFSKDERRALSLTDSWNFCSLDRNVSLCCSCAVFRVLSRGKTHLVLSDFGRAGRRNFRMFFSRFTHWNNTTWIQNIRTKMKYDQLLVAWWAHLQHGGIVAVTISSACRFIKTMDRPLLWHGIWSTSSATNQQEQLWKSDLFRWIVIWAVRLGGPIALH